MQVADPARRAALVRLLRAGDGIRLVGSEGEADVVLRDAQPEPLAAPAPPRPAPGEALTAREIEVLRRLAEGENNREIGTALGIAPSTVKHHLESIYLKLDVGNRTEAVREGLRRGWVAL